MNVKKDSHVDLDLIRKNSLRRRAERAKKIGSFDCVGARFAEAKLRSG
jgi:hypothetical protein